MNVQSHWMVPLAVVFIIAMGGAYLPPSDPGTDFEPEVHYVGAGGFEKVQDAIDFARPGDIIKVGPCLLYTSPSPRDRQRSRMPSSA